MVHDPHAAAPADGPDPDIERALADISTAVVWRHAMLRRMLAAATPEQRAGAARVSASIAEACGLAADKCSARTVIPIACNAAELPCYELAVAAWNLDRNAPRVTLKLTAPAVDLDKLDERQRGAVALLGRFLGTDIGGQAVGYINVTLLEN